MKYDTVRRLYYVEVPYGTHGSLLSFKSNGDCAQCEDPTTDDTDFARHDDYTMARGAVFSQLLRQTIDLDTVNSYWGHRPTYSSLADDRNTEGLYCRAHRFYHPCRFCERTEDPWLS